ncbi:MAG: hypothetical protein IPL97_09220 [Niastella sp.]|nr:hypothetical protein [Niastella sp.]
MKSCISILSLCFLIISCNQSSQTEKDYIKNLEEKNKLLEKELKETKSKTEQNTTSNGKKGNIASSKDYFTIGSSEDEVLEIMGDPTRLLDMNSLGKRFYYGLSVVVFEKGKVVSYDNFDENLKVRVKR